MDDDGEYHAGLELDIQIAERFGGFQEIAYRWYDGTTQRMLWHPDDPPPKGDDFQPLPDGRLCAWDAIPRYSTDIAAAWDLVDLLSERGYWVLVEQRPANSSFIPQRLCGTCRIDTAQVTALADDIEVDAETVPLAICGAALLLADALLT